MGFYDSGYSVEKLTQDRQNRFLAEAARERLVKKPRGKNAAIANRVRQWLRRSLIVWERWSGVADPAVRRTEVALINNICISSLCRK